jgi:hypothetical protein
MSKIKSTLSKSLPAIIVSVITTTAIIYAWTEPTQTPPNNNVPAPINVGTLEQSFLGSKTLTVRNGGVLSINGGFGVLGVFQASGGSGRTVLSVAGNNVGIGANATNTVKLLIQDSISQGGILKLQNTRSQANDTWWIGFTHGFNSSDANDRARIGVNIHPAGPGRLVFYTGSAGNQIERMRIDESGNVGIGTPNPTQKLDVEGYVRGSQGLCIGNDCRTSWPSFSPSSSSDFIIYTCEEPYWLSDNGTTTGSDGSTISNGGTCFNKPGFYNRNYYPLGATLCSTSSNCPRYRSSPYGNYFINPRQCPEGYYLYLSICLGDCTDDDSAMTICKR